MRALLLVPLAGLMASTAYAAQTIGASAAVQAPAENEAKARREAKNWDVLHSMYPKRALENHEEGLVGFTVRIDAAGSPTECAITHTSGHPLLDQETCQLIMIHATFKRPEGISLSQQRLYEGVVNWKLPSTPMAAVPAIPQAIKAAEAPAKLYCKRTAKVGTLAAFERTCMTTADWDRYRTEYREWWEENRKKGSTSGRL